MTDIVERLRQPWFTNGCEAYQLEAATEIERLRKHAEATDLWCVMKRRSLEWQMEPYILRGATSDPKYHQLLGQHIAFGRMRSYLSGARRAEYPEEK